jgi:choline dehydrogenase-like flavoprotein
MTAQPRRPVYDVCIVGSGAGGAMAAYELTRQGARVVVLEAGPWWDNSKDSAMLKMPWDTPLRGGSTPERPFGEHDACLGGWDIPGEPYTVAQGSQFRWWRGRMLGGRTNHWGRISLRFGPRDFKSRSHDGLGDDWPISYGDLKPYYDRVDRLIGIFGSREGLENHPDGEFLPPPAPRCYERLVMQASKKLNVTCIPARLSIITKPLGNRAPCHYCGQCNRGCMTNSNFSAPNVLLFPAMKTGRLTILSNAMAREVTVNDQGLATGVSYIDKKAGQDEHVQARIVVLAASSCESSRILLNSKSSRFPQGLANSSGIVGKYLTDTTGTDVTGYIPAMERLPAHNCDGVGGGHVYMPWWLDNAKLDFPRGYHIEIWGGRTMPSYGMLGGIQRYPDGGGYGASLKDSYRKYWGTTIGFSGRGEMIPNERTYCELDPEKKDQFGIPVLRFHFQWTDHEYNQVKHMQETFRALIAEMGGQVFSPMPTKAQGYGISTGGQIIHELGTVRMGDKASTSALNANCQAWDCRNLFVADGGPFVSQCDKNPTWTILALSMRAAEYITAQRKAGAL